MKAMSSQALHAVDSSLCLKEPSGWFAAGTSFRQALAALSDGAFKLFAHICLQADRRTGRYEAVQAELASAIDKSRRIVGKYVEELESKRVCTVRRGTNQYARTSFEIRDEFWPYHRAQNVEGANGQVHNAYVDAIRRSFVSIGCTIGKFSARDEKLAKELQQCRIPLELVLDALLMGACRKYISWLNGRSAEPIASLKYFEGLIAEIRERPLPADYREYLQKKVEQLTRAWAKESVKLPKTGGCSDMPRPEIVQ
jgi:hypothetical protein